MTREVKSRKDVGEGTDNVPALTPSARFALETRFVKSLVVQCSTRTASRLQLKTDAQAYDCSPADKVSHNTGNFGQLWRYLTTNREEKSNWNK